MYVATVLLRRTEAEFWRMTPRKLHTLSKTHGDLNGGAKDEPKQGFIDNVM